MELEFDPAQWEYACEHYWQDIYLPAEFTTGGISTSCTFRIRGATSREYPKKSIKIEFPSGVFLFGVDELNLNGEYIDKTRIRELLSYLYYAETGQIVPEVHLVEVVFNGVSQGAYISVEDVDGDFLLRTDLPDDGVIYKCSNRYTTLDRPGDLEPYSKKTHENSPWDDFLLLVYWLNLSSDEDFERLMQERFHFDDLISAIASNILLGHGSTYYHNYLLLLDSDGARGRWRYITWDMDRTWGSYGPWSPYWKNSSNSGNRRNTMIWRMFCMDSIRERIISEVLEQYPEYLAFSESGKLDSLAELAAPLVEADPFRDYTMDQYWGDIEYLRNWPANRYSALTEQFYSWPLPFQLYSPEQEGQMVRVSWGSAGSEATYRLEVSPDSLFAHQEEIVYETSTGDTSVVLPAGVWEGNHWMQVYAQRNGTEHRSANGPMRTLPDSRVSPVGELVISEINCAGSPLLNSGDWFEVVNTGDQPVSLAGWSFRDGGSGNLSVTGNITALPEEPLILAADSFLFSSAYPGLPPTTSWLNFNLSDQGEPLFIEDVNGNTVDSLFYRTEHPWPSVSGGGSTLLLLDLSMDNSLPLSWIAGPFGGTPFSVGEWDPSWPEAGAVNAEILGPVPCTDRVSLRLITLSETIAELNVYDLAGRTTAEPVLMELLPGSLTVSVNTSELNPGVYFAVVRNMGYCISRKFLVWGYE